MSKRGPIVSDLADQLAVSVRQWHWRAEGNVALSQVQHRGVLGQQALVAEAGVGHLQDEPTGRVVDHDVLVLMTAEAAKGTALAVPLDSESRRRDPWLRFGLGISSPAKGLLN